MPHWVKREDRRPEEEGAAEVEQVLKVVQERIIECRIKEWREVRCPHHEDEQEPGKNRVADDANDAALQQRQDPRSPARRGEAEDQRHGSGAKDQDWNREEEDQVLHHMHAKERGVVTLDHRLQRDQQEGRSAKDRNASRTRDRVLRVLLSNAAHRNKPERKASEDQQANDRWGVPVGNRGEARLRWEGAVRGNKAEHAHPPYLRVPAGFAVAATIRE